MQMSVELERIVMTKVSFASHPRVEIASAWNWFGKYRPLTLLVLLCVASIPAFSQVADSNPSPSPLVNWGNQPNFLGNFWGARTKLADQDGISFSGFDQNDFFADPSVGNVQLIPNVLGQTGTGDWNRVRGTLDIDMNKFAHIQGSSLHITSTLNQGTDVGSAPYMPNLAGDAAAGNDTVWHQLRLDSWWVKQDLFHSKVSLYVGQISGMDFFGFLPQDFTHFASLGPFYGPLALYNSFESADPMTTPAAMIQITPNKHFYFRSMLQSITEGNPSDPHSVLNFYNWFNNPTGTSMQMKDGAVSNNQVAYLNGRSEAHFGVSFSGAKAYTQWTGSAANGTLVTVPGFTKASNGGYENFYWTLKQTIYRPANNSHRSVDLGGTYVWGPADKGVLPYNSQLVLTSEFNGLVARRPKDAINVSFNYMGIRGPLQTPTYKSEKVYEVNYSFQINKWLQWMPDLQLHQDIGANPKNGTGVIVGFRSLVMF
jgi:carbohydrate-selective porin OprB